MPRLPQAARVPRAAARRAQAARAQAEGRRAGGASADPDLDARLAGGERDAIQYSPRDTYAIDQFVRHPTFGVGLVVALPAAQKVEVAFHAGRKLLVHQRGDAPAAPTLQRPQRRDDDEPRGVTDAPDRTRTH